MPAPISAFHPPSAVTAPDNKPVARGAVAGLMLLSSILLCGVIGAIVGAVAGAVGIFLAVGIFIGFVAGIVAVRARFPDL